MTNINNKNNAYVKINVEIINDLYCCWSNKLPLYYFYSVQLKPGDMLIRAGMDSETSLKE